MVSPSEAIRIILSHAKPLAVESIQLSKAVGRVLREDIKSDRDQPPFDKCLLDGIAISFEAWQKGIRQFNVQAIVPPGIAAKPLKNSSYCLRVMTGAVLPKGCHCVIPIDQIDLEGNIAEIKDWTIVKKNQNIRFQAADGKRGKVLLKHGCQLLAPHIATAAIVGKSTFKVSALPKIAMIATGDELVDISKPIKQYQTRLSNSYALQALFHQAKLGDVQIFHAPDNEQVIFNCIKEVLGKFDVVILSGGLSMGAFDYVPKVLAKVGIKKLFHKVSQRPGKPFWFGTAQRGKPVFALPGNPVSAQICAFRYIVPFLKKASGLDVKQEFVEVAENINIQSDLTQFLPVLAGKLVVVGGLGDFASLAQADGFIEYDSHKNQHRWPYFSWRV
ncbi:MAG: molybdopterin molybdotransferase MoeA [Candidatus Omnitrophica bacterium]|nr:molybdopterin molybdotransferase MoeA [Candidatus Omnitrophota bacterium]